MCKGTGGGIGSGRGNGYGPVRAGAMEADSTAPVAGLRLRSLSLLPTRNSPTRPGGRNFRVFAWFSLVVDAEGSPQRVSVVRHVGMGLDQRRWTL